MALRLLRPFTMLLRHATAEGFLVPDEDCPQAVFEEGRIGAPHALSYVHKPRRRRAILEPILMVDEALCTYVLPASPLAALWAQDRNPTGYQPPHLPLNSKQIDSCHDRGVARDYRSTVDRRREGEELRQR